MFMNRLGVNIINSFKGHSAIFVAQLMKGTPVIVEFIDRRDMAMLKNLIKHNSKYADISNLDKAKQILNMDDIEAIEFCERNKINPNEYTLD